ncbi:hypothetical protein N7495_005352 [Penicillium taxi]|uniref:uncharacterized protein n=1 Tax=Penicillium taxi TaxID=168475 RepID=UPI002545149B|nr:uncharacterized protein N7495_005352 [Penicillium taxi]KAJ5893661.1 hypothetical protein N7495_005352 [Penicillium taxi]
MSESERRLRDSTTDSDMPVESSGSEAPGPSNDSVQPISRSRRRRRPANSDKEARKQSFYFVDSNSSSKEKRAHVMRHHVQEKKKQQKTSHKSIPADQIPESVSHLGRDGYDEDDRKEAVLLLTSAPEPVPGASAGQDSLSSQPIRFAMIKPYSQQNMKLPLDSPMTVLDQSRNDPFSSLPMAQDPENLELMSCWNNLTYWSGENTYVKDALFKTAMAHPISFQATILTYCARWKARHDGLSDSKQVRRHVHQAQRNIQDAIAGSLHVPEDALAMAMTGMALQEERFGSVDISQSYLSQAMQIMRPRPGSNPPVESFVQYVGYMLPSQPMVAKVSDQKRLVTFLRRAEDLTQEHSSPAYLLKSPQRTQIFQLGSPLFPLLSSGPRPSQIPQESRVYVVRGSQDQEVIRTASLILVTLGLLDLQDSIEKTNRFLGYLNGIVAQQQLDRYPACETLMWLLLEQRCDSDLRNPERPWIAGEFLQTLKQLQSDLLFQFNEILMDFLTLRPRIRGLGTFEEKLEQYQARQNNK